jgi:uncharacterized membrane protein YheB (UPF0754 family)
VRFVSLLIFLPLVGAIIGYTTKWAAIQMIFRPARWVGIGPIGWQGIVQRRSPKFAAGIADTVTQSAMSIDELIDRIDPVELAALLGPAIDELGPEIARDVVEAVKPGLWGELAEPAREAIIGYLRQESASLITDLVERLKPTISSTLDVRAMVIELLSGDNADRWARLVQRVGARELQWVIWYGAVFGFFIGLVEVFGYAALDKLWLLPLVGAFDGVVNNWLAIQMIFRPLERTRYLGVFPYQGLFPARQKEIAGDYAQMMASEVLTGQNLASRLMEGDNAAGLMQAAFVALEDRMEAQLGAITTLVGVESSPELRTKVLHAVSGRLMGAVPALMPDLESYLEKRLDIAATLEERLAAMDKEEFETVLRGIFEEDEWILISLGGFLGGAIGLLQAGLVAATGLGH